MKRCPACNLKYNEDDGHSCMESRGGLENIISINPTELVKYDEASDT